MFFLPFVRSFSHFTRLLFQAHLLVAIVECPSLYAEHAVSIGDRFHLVSGSVHVAPFSSETERCLQGDGGMHSSLACFEFDSEKLYTDLDFDRSKFFEIDRNIMLNS